MLIAQIKRYETIKFRHTIQITPRRKVLPTTTQDKDEKDSLPEQEEIFEKSEKFKDNEST